MRSLPFLVGLWFSGCGCSERTGTALDAGAEPVDSGEDATVAADAFRGADVDAIVDPDDPIWVPLPGLPTGCVIERAERPEVLFSPDWEPCPERSGCLRLAEQYEYQRSFDVEGAYHDGERGYFVVIQGFRNQAYRIVILAATEGPPFAAWRDDVNPDDGVCNVFPTAIGAGTAAVVAFSSWQDAWPRENRVYHASWDEIGSKDEPDVLLGAPFIPGSSSPQNLAVSPTTVALEIQSAGFVALVEGDKYLRMDNLPGELAGVPQNVQVVGSHVFWEEWGSFVRVAHGSMTQPTSLFFAVDDADVKGFVTDGVDIAWLQEYERNADGTYERIELWAAPYTDDPSSLKPRMVRELPEHNAVVKLGGGIFATLHPFERDHFSIRLYDLADGRLRVADFPEGYEIGTPAMYVTPTELMASGRGRNGNATTLFRIDITSLPYEE